MTVVFPFWNSVTATTWGFRWQYRLQRWRRAWRYATKTMSREDAGCMRQDCQDVEGFWPLEAIDVEDVLRDALERWADHPALERLAYDAAERIADRWSGSGDISCEARGCAVDLIAEYASAQGIELVERGDEPAETD